MGILRFLKSLSDSEVMGEEVIIAIQKLYKQTQDLSPHDEPHESLSKTWLSRARARGIDINTQEVAMGAWSSTQLFSLLPHGANIRAMAIHILFLERPDIQAAYPKFEQEYDHLMKPIMAVLAKGEDEVFEELYKKYNPRLAKEAF